MDKGQFLRARSRWGLMTLYSCIFEYGFNVAQLKFHGPPFPPPLSHIVYFPSLFNNWIRAAIAGECFCRCIQGNFSPGQVAYRGRVVSSLSKLSPSLWRNGRNKTTQQHFMLSITCWHLDQSPLSALNPPRSVKSQHKSSKSKCG